MDRNYKLNYESPVFVGIEVRLEQVIAASKEVSMDGGITQETWVEEDISTGDIELL